MTKSAACIVLINSYGQILAIKRASTGLWGLPGGKVDDGETTEDAAIRELKEETSLTVRIEDIEYLYTALVEGSINYITTCYLANHWEGVLIGSDEGWPHWVEPNDFLANTQFKLYNNGVIKQLLKKSTFQLEAGWPTSRRRIAKYEIEETTDE